MKTSNKLLILLFTVVLFVIAGTNLILKEEYEKIDLNDPFYGYSSEMTEPFRVIELTGNGKGLIRIQEGERFQLRVKDEQKGQVSRMVENDTLKLTLTPERDQHITGGADRFSLPAEVYIMVPEISSVHSENVRTTIGDWRGGSLTINAEGPEGGIFLQNNTLDSVSANISEGGLVKTGTNNSLKHMNLQVSKNSSFEAEKDIFQSVEITADSLASLKLPASVLKKIAQENILMLR